MSKQRQNSVLFFAFLTAFSLAARFYIVPNFIKTKSNVQIGPEMYPKLITTLMIALALIGLIMEYRAMRAAGESFAGYSADLKKYIPHVFLLASGVAFLIAAPVLGFFVAAVPFMLFLLYLFGSEGKLTSVIISVVYPAILVLLFSQVLRVNFPAGIFGI